MKSLQHYILVTILFLMAPFVVFGQTTENEGVFAFAFNKYGAHATDKAIPEKKYEIAKDVFDDLVEAKGVKNMLRPQFIMQNAERRPAWTKPSEALVVLEEKAFDLCMRQGKDSLNAIAALLAHELIHYYEKHDWHHGMARELYEFGVLSSSENKGGSEQLEFEADFLGGMLAHMAGYQILGIMPDLLGQIYNSYQLTNHENNTHPSIEDRRSIAVKSDVLLTKHSRIFDMSLYLTTIGEYDLASDYLHYIITQTHFQSREIYNNLGVLYLLRVIDSYGPNELRYQFPVELELSSRLNQKGSGEQERKEHLENARYYLKNAVILDEQFVPAQINLSIAYLLEGTTLDARYYANKALNRAELIKDSKGISDAQIVLGILADREGDPQSASAHFINSDSPLGRYNLCVLNEEDNCAPEINRSENRSVPDIDDVSLDQLYARIMQDKEEALLSVDLDLVNSFHTIAKDHSEIYVHLNNQAMGVYSFFQIINTSSISDRNGLKVGSNITTVEERLGAPTAVFCSTNSCLRHYENEHLILRTNQLEEVTEWIVYKNSAER